MQQNYDIMENTLTQMLEEMKMDVVQHVEEVTTITFINKEEIKNVIECLK
jgi:hypothetical protein